MYWLDKLRYILIGSVVVGMFWVGTASASIDTVQIKSMSTKDIGYFIPNRQIKTIEYVVHLRGYRLECISVLFTRRDGAVLSHAHNDCVSHLEGE